MSSKDGALSESDDGFENNEQLVGPRVLKELESGQENYRFSIYFWEKIVARKRKCSVSASNTHFEHITLEAPAGLIPLGLRKKKSFKQMMLK